MRLVLGKRSRSGLGVGIDCVLLGGESDDYEQYLYYYRRILVCA